METQHFKHRYGVDFDEFNNAVEEMRERYNPIEAALLKYGIVDNRVAVERNPAYSDYIKIKLEEPLPKKLPKKKMNIVYSDHFNGNINVQPIEQKIKLVGKTDKGSLQSISRNAAQDSLHPFLTGVYFDAENKVMVATDAYKMVWIDAPDIKESKLINPKTGATMDAKFPNWKAVIPTDNPINLKSLPMSDLLNQTNGIDRANKFISGKQLAAVIKIKDTCYAFDPKFLNDVLKTFAEHGAKGIDLDLSIPTRGMVFSSNETPNVHGLLTPIFFNYDTQPYKLIYETQNL